MNRVAPASRKIGVPRFVRAGLPKLAARFAMFRQLGARETTRFARLPSASVAKTRVSAMLSCTDSL